MSITGSEAVIKFLIDEGIDTIFGFPGGAIIPIYNALYDYQSQIKHILVRHEQAAVHAAEGYARVTGKPGVCFATSGPGATNLTTGIADAMMDSVPVVCITGQVHTSVIGSDAFQEIDIIGITTPITKWNYQITDAKEIPAILKKAFHIANSGRPGPVLIDIAKNAQTESLNYFFPKLIKIESYQPNTEPNIKQIKFAAKVLNDAKQPLVLIGHGVIISQAEKESLKLIEKADIPAASTMLGLSALPSDHRLNMGMIGMHGNCGPNILTNQADVILALGMRFDDRVTGRLSDYARKAKIIHIDIDPAELNKNVQSYVPVVADVKKALLAILPHIENKDHLNWINQFKKHNAIEYQKVIEKEIYPKVGEITMGEVVNFLSQKTKGKSIILADVGQHQMITARYYKFNHQRGFITSGGLGTMGFALPAAVGAKIASPNDEIIAIIGDGGFQMNIQELATISENNIAVKIIILRNDYLGMVRQWQELFFAKRYSFTSLKNPDFIQIAKGYFIEGQRVTQRKELNKALDKLLQAKKPYLLEIKVKSEQNVFPMIAPGASVEEIRFK